MFARAMGVRHWLRMHIERGIAYSAPVRRFSGVFFYVYSIEMTDVYVDLGFAVVFSA